MRSQPMFSRNDLARLVKGECCLLKPEDQKKYESERSRLLASCSDVMRALVKHFASFVFPKGRPDLHSFDKSYIDSYPNSWGRRWEREQDNRNLVISQAKSNFIRKFIQVLESDSSVLDIKKILEFNGLVSLYIIPNIREPDDHFFIDAISLIISALSTSTFNFISFKCDIEYSISGQYKNKKKQFIDFLNNNNFDTIELNPSQLTEEVFTKEIGVENWKKIVGDKYEGYKYKALYGFLKNGMDDVDYLSELLYSFRSDEYKWLAAILLVDNTKLDAATRTFLEISSSSPHYESARFSAFNHTYFDLRNKGANPSIAFLKSCCMLLNSDNAMVSIKSRKDRVLFDSILLSVVGIRGISAARVDNADTRLLLLKYALMVAKLNDKEIGANASQLFVKRQQGFKKILGERLPKVKDLEELHGSRREIDDLWNFFHERQAITPFSKSRIGEFVEAVQLLSQKTELSPRLR